MVIFNFACSFSLLLFFKQNRKKPKHIQILQEEKTVLTTMERRLQERCAELQREVFRLQGAHNNDGYKSLEKHPVALPRQVLPRTNNKTGSSEHEDEGISSSETGQSLSPEPILILPQNATKKYSLMSNNNEYNGNNNSNNGVGGGNNNNVNHNNNSSNNNAIVNKDDDVTTTIEEVIEELENIVHDAEQDMQQDLKSNRSKSSENLMVSAYHVKSSHLHSNNNCNNINSNSNSNCMNKIRNDQYHQEKEIVPVNLLPQPPKKSRSLSHLLSGGSDFDESDYGVIMANNETRISYYDDIDMEIEHSRQHGYRNEPDGVSGGGGGGGIGSGINGETNPDLINQTSTNRELLNVIMDAREKDENIFMTAPGHYSQMIKAGMHDGQSLMPKTAPQKFNGVFFMTEMSKEAKYAPDITAALEARRVSKSIERLESYGGSSGLDSMIDIIMTSERKQEMKNAIAKAPNNFAALRDMALNSTFSMRTKSPTSTLPPDGCGVGVGSGGGGGGHQSSVVYTAGIKTTRMAYACNGSKLSDLPSGLY